jgi:photosystem II stability/assembly factor-like uncharacterized protein
MYRLFLLAGTMVVFFPLSSSSARDSSINRVYRSTDQGRSWTESDYGLERNARVNALARLNKSVFAATDAGFFISADSGVSWQRTAEIKGFRPVCLAAKGDKIFMGTDQAGMFISTNQGKRWQPANTGLSTLRVRSLLLFNDTLFAGTDTAGVFKSDDDGTTWKSLNVGLPPTPQVHEMVAIGNNVFAALYSKGLYRLNPEESTWNKAGKVTPLTLAHINNTLIAGHNPGGIYWSSDLGETWNRPHAATDSNLTLSGFEEKDDLSADAPVWTLASDRTRVFAGASNGIYYSEDSGKTWTRAQVGSLKDSPGVAFLVGDDFVLAATIVKE